MLPPSAPSARRDPVLVIAVSVLAVSAALAFTLTATGRSAPSGSAAPFAGPSSSGPAWAHPTPTAGSTAPSSAAAQPSAGRSSGALPPSGAPSAGATGMPDCPPSGVLVRAGGVDAAMGLRAMGLELLNCGTRTYRVRGYPVVRVLDAAYAPLDLDVVNGRSAVTALESVDAAPRPVTLRAGESAWATLVWRTTARDGAYLAVTPSPGQAPQTVKPEGGIDLGDTGRLGVGPWTVVSRR